MDRHGYLERKVELRARIEQELAQVAGDPDPDCRESTSRWAEAAYREACQTLLAEALGVLERRMEELRTQIKERRAARCEQQRRVLGDVLAADILRQRLERVSPPEILQAYVDAADEWEATLIACYAEMILRPDSQELAELHTLAGDGQFAACRSELVTLERDARELWIALQPEAFNW